MKLPSNPICNSTLLLLPVFLFGCYPGNKPDGHPVLVENPRSNSFAEYWYTGQGEVNTFDLEQSRYGETRKGEAVMVFVTEDFSKNKQVKLDHPDKNPGDKVSVLKINHIRRFETGVYDYSMMQSVFTPIDLSERPRSLKATTTSQDWCGHTFLQMNLEDGGYRYNSFSYFESEGDVTTKLKADLLEDEIWNLIRISPDHLPEGNYNVVPAAFYSRLAHDPIKAKQARIRWEKQEQTHYFVLEYLHLDRTITIGFAPSFPHKILSWTEVQDGKMLSKGKLKGSIKSAYWRQNGNQYMPMRDSLGL